MGAYAHTQPNEATGRWRDVFWLAWRDIRRSWLGYVLSAGYLLLSAAFVAPRGEIPLGTWSPEIIFLLMVMLLAQPFMSSEYFAWDNDKVAERLTFLRLFPIPLGVIVGGRMLAIVAAALLNVPAFFFPLYVVGEWDLGVGEFVWFAMFWTGISIGLTGYGLCMEMGTGIKRWVLTNVALLVVLGVAVTVLGEVFDIWLVERSVGLLDRGGPLVALASLVIGVGVYIWSGRVAEGLLRRRELAP